MPDTPLPTSSVDVPNCAAGSMAAIVASLISGIASISSSIRSYMAIRLGKSSSSEARLT